MAYELTGEIKHISETEVFASGFQKRFLILEAQDGDYKNEYGFQVMKDNVDKYDSLSVGQEVTVHFNLGRSREYNSKWYADMHTAWKVEAVGSAPASEDVPPVDDDGLDEEIPFNDG